MSSRLTILVVIFGALFASAIFLWADIVSPGQTPTTRSTPVISPYMSSGPRYVSSTPSPSPVQAGFIFFDVPFTPQAPFGNWGDIRQEEGCEEAAALMAMRWVEGRSLSAAEAEREIITVSDWEEKTYGDFYNTSAADTASRIIKGYYVYKNVAVKYDVGSEDIKRELAVGNLVIVPVNGRVLANPFYTRPGPLEHMVVVRGYDPDRDEFITNDSGTKRGEGYRYGAARLEGALQDYPTGRDLPIPKVRTAMIVISPKNVK